MYEVCAFGRSLWVLLLDHVTLHLSAAVGYVICTEINNLYETLLHDTWANCDDGVRDVIYVKKS